MDNINNIVIGVVIFVITSIIAYLFRIRQLYIVIPKLYRHSAVSDNGTLCEIVILNRGARVEEEIKVELDHELKYELLATNSSDIVLKDCTIHIERLHKKSDTSVLLLVEKGLLDSTKIISISSKKTKGAIKKTISGVPNHFASIAIIIAFYISILPAIYFGESAYKYLSSKNAESKLHPIIKKGWSNLGGYSVSDFRNNYSDYEFPIQYIGQKLENEHLKISYEIYNKSAGMLTVVAIDNDIAEAHRGEPNYKMQYFAGTNVPQMSKSRIDVIMTLPLEDPSKVTVKFALLPESSSDVIFGITNTVTVEK